MESELSLLDFERVFYVFMIQNFAINFQPTTINKAILTVLMLAASIPLTSSFRRKEFDTTQEITKFIIDVILVYIILYFFCIQSTVLAHIFLQWTEKTFEMK